MPRDTTRGRRARRAAYITLHYITSCYIKSHHITLHYIILHYITLHYIVSHNVILHSIGLDGLPCHGEDPITDDSPSAINTPDVAMEGVARYADSYFSQTLFYEVTVV